MLYVISLTSQDFGKQLYCAIKHSYAYASNPVPSLNRSMHMLSGSSDQHSKQAESRLIIYNVEGPEIIITASAGYSWRLYFQTNARHNQEKWLWICINRLLSAATVLSLRF